MENDFYNGLLYKTLFDGSPTGKQRVFWACHPADHDACFPEISRDILEVNSNVAVWYCDPDRPEPSGEATELLKKDLDQMLLVVLPVTTAFLYEASVARDIVFPHAFDHGIPILPILMESGLALPFNKICRNLQYIDRTGSDPTEIPYREKLKKYLNGILVPDELEKKIRQAFYAYIFLSYRKKNRYYAQQIMEMIHRNELCRDIAIWYDEFLTPGEDFNRNIQSAFEKSDIFVMVVSDYLMNLPNYVHSEEFPMAQRKGIDILPVLAGDGTGETVKKLAENFPGSPDCVEDEETFSFKIGAILDRLKKPKKEDTPEHLYLIGLAYLNGIDMETNPEKGAELIREAAGRGLPEAQGHLARMYNAGLGVKRDYDRAAREQEKYVQLLEEAGRADSFDASYGSALLDLGDMLLELHRFSEAMPVYVKLVGYAERKAGDFDFDWMESVAFERQGRAAQGMHDSEKAYECYSRCLSVRRNLMEDHPYADVFSGLAFVTERLGDLSFGRGKYEEALKLFETSLKSNLLLTKENNTAEHSRYCSLNYVRLGDVETVRGNLKSARAYYEKGLEINERILSEFPGAHTERDISVSWERLGHVSESEADIEKALEWFQKCLTLRRKLADASGTLEALQDLGTILDTLGVSFRNRGDYTRAQEYSRESLEIREDLVRRSPAPEFRKDLSVSCNRLAELFRLRRRFEEALPWYDRALQIRKELVRETGTPDAYRDLASSYTYLGDLERSRNSSARALEYYLEGYGILSGLKEAKTHPDLLGDYGTLCERLGDLALAADETEKASGYYRDCTDSREKLVSLKPAADSYRNLGISYERLGDLAREKENYPEAANYFRRSLDISMKLASEADTPQARRDVSIGLEKTGVALAYMEEIDEAEELLLKCLSIRRRLALELETVQAYEDLKCCYSWLIEIAEANSDMVKMFRYADEIKRIDEEYLHSRG